MIKHIRGFLYVVFFSWWVGDNRLDESFERAKERERAE